MRLLLTLLSTLSLAHAACNTYSTTQNATGYNNIAFKLVGATPANYTFVYTTGTYSHVRVHGHGHVDVHVHVHAHVHADVDVDMDMDACVYGLCVMSSRVVGLVSFRAASLFRVVAVAVSVCVFVAR